MRGLLRTRSAGRCRRTRFGEVPSSEPTQRLASRLRQRPRKRVLRAPGTGTDSIRPSGERRESPAEVAIQSVPSGSSWERGDLVAREAIAHREDRGDLAREPDASSPPGCRPRRRRPGPRGGSEWPSRAPSHVRRRGGPIPLRSGRGPWPFRPRGFPRALREGRRRGCGGARGCSSGRRRRSSRRRTVRYPPLVPTQRNPSRERAGERAVLWGPSPVLQEWCRYCVNALRVEGLGRESETKDADATKRALRGQPESSASSPLEEYAESRLRRAIVGVRDRSFPLFPQPPRRRRGPARGRRRPRPRGRLLEGRREGRRQGPSTSAGPGAPRTAFGARRPR